MQETNAQQLEVLRLQLQRHQSEEGHVASMRRLRVLEDRFEQSQRETSRLRSDLERVYTMQGSALRRLDALCAASPGCTSGGASRPP